MSQPDREVDTGTRVEVIDSEFSREDLLHLHSSMVASFEQEIGNTNSRHLSVTAKREDGTLLGALSGSTFWNWLSIDMLWIRPDCRRRGLGASLVAAAEAEASRRGCRAAHFDTFSPGAVQFYERCGYEVASVLAAPGVGASRYSLFKLLQGNAQRSGAGSLDRP